MKTVPPLSQVTPRFRSTGPATEPDYTVDLKISQRRVRCPGVFRSANFVSHRVLSGYLAYRPDVLTGKLVGEVGCGVTLRFGLQEPELPP